LRNPAGRPFATCRRPHRTRPPPVAGRGTESVASTPARCLEPITSSGIQKWNDSCVIKVPRAPGKQSGGTLTRLPAGPSIDLIVFYLIWPAEWRRRRRRRQTFACAMSACLIVSAHDHRRRFAPVLTLIQFDRLQPSDNASPNSGADLGGARAAVLPIGGGAGLGRARTGAAAPAGAARRCAFIS
jgi:hypothetical protein